MSDVTIPAEVLREVVRELASRPSTSGIAATLREYIPKPRFEARISDTGHGWFSVYEGRGVKATGIPTREAAERIAAIYEEACDD